MLATGLHDVPTGKIAVVVTRLEMRAKPALPAAPMLPGTSLMLQPKPQTDWYRALFRAVGSDWLWQSRLRLPDVDLAQILSDPDVLVFALMRDGQAQGLVELNFRTLGSCELAFFGLAPAMIGTGAGRMMMTAALDHAWSRPIDRLHLQTCTSDHPGALGFYQRTGFTIYARQIEIAPDPRLDGVLPSEVAPHIPVIG